jgi:hypothetical protein
VDTHQQSGDRLPQTPQPPQAYETDVFGSLSHLADARVKAIIAANDRGVSPETAHVARAESPHPSAASDRLARTGHATSVAGGRPL